jgi:carbon starvation protein CstA
MEPPQWRWKTFPVYFAASLALFVGVYVGYLAGYLQFEEGNNTFGMLVFILSAIFLGFGFSRLTTRFLLSRQWIKPRQRRR